MLRVVFAGIAALGVQAQLGKQRAVALCLGVAGGQQLVAVENRVGTGQKGKRLGGFAHLLAACREAHMALGHHDARHGNGADERQRVQVLRVFQRGARYLYQHVDRHRLRMRGEPGQLLQQRAAILGAFAHAENTARTHLHTGVAHGGQSFQAVAIGARGDDFAVVVGGGVEVVVVVVQPRGGQPGGLFTIDHAQRHAGFEPQRFHLAHHLFHRQQILVLGAAPGRSHAEAAGACLFGGLGLGHHFLYFQQLLFFQLSVVVTRLGAVLAVFRAGPGLDRQQGRHLHCVGIEVCPMYLLGLKQQVVEGQRKQRVDFLEGPVMARRGIRRVRSSRSSGHG